MVKRDLRMGSIARLSGLRLPYLHVLMRTVNNLMDQSLYVLMLMVTTTMDQSLCVLMLMVTTSWDLLVAENTNLFCKVKYHYKAGLLLDWLRFDSCIVMNRFTCLAESSKTDCHLYLPTVILALTKLMSFVWTWATNFWRECVCGKIQTPDQRDQFGRFFALWATIECLWQQLFYPNCPHCSAIFVKVPKPIIFVVKSYLGTFKDIWRFLSGHTAREIPSIMFSS